MIPASSLQEAFPDVNPGVMPLGTRVLVQLRTVRSKTSSGLILVDDTKQFNKVTTQLGRVIQIGPIAFRNRETGQLWPEGVWAQPGHLVRIPKYGGDRFERKIPGTDDTALFCLFSDHEIIARVDPDAFEELDEIL
ncbi:MAG: co-chaperone GroES [Pseudomonas sp.]|nr:co-chaperone GroES [Pseudomonas sp.]